MSEELIDRVREVIAQNTNDITKRTLTDTQFAVKIKPLAVKLAAALEAAGERERQLLAGITEIAKELRDKSEENDGFDTGDAWCRSHMDSETAIAIADKLAALAAKDEGTNGR